MFDIAVSQLTTPRWEFAEELASLAHHGFRAISLWRPKLSDTGLAATGRELRAVGVRASSLQWVGGFTGSDGRTFAESVADAAEAIGAAASLAAASSARPPVVIVHSGCRGGHTRSHAERLLCEAIETLSPLARTEGVVLAIKPFHSGGAAGCSFLTQLGAAVELVERCADPHVRIALDLWHFADSPEFDDLLPRLAAVTGIVQIADRHAAPTPVSDRLPAGGGELPLESRLNQLVEQGYVGDVEFDPVGEAVQELGYDGAYAETRRVADLWLDQMEASMPARLLRVEPAHLPHRGIQRRAAGAGGRRSQASTQVVSRG
jgi:sugar phosphate isomerase/epimerase